MVTSAGRLSELWTGVIVEDLEYVAITFSRDSEVKTLVLHTVLGCVRTKSSFVPALHNLEWHLESVFRPCGCSLYPAVEPRPYNGAVVTYRRQPSRLDSRKRTVRQWTMHAMHIQPFFIEEGALPAFYGRLESVAELSTCCLVHPLKVTPFT